LDRLEKIDQKYIPSIKIRLRLIREGSIQEAVKNSLDVYNILREYSKIRTGSIFWSFT
jgi:hypothetical protein